MILSKLMDLRRSSNHVQHKFLTFSSPHSNQAESTTTQQSQVRRMTQKRNYKV